MTARRWLLMALTLHACAGAGGCSASVEETPLTPAEKEAMLRDYAEAHRELGPLGVAPRGPASLCASSTKAVRTQARIGRGQGPEGFGTKGCPAGDD